MRRGSTYAALVLVSLLTAASVLSACNTMEGAGKDIKSAGSSLEKSADDNK
jgi:entericidin B